MTYTKRQVRVGDLAHVADVSDGSWQWILVPVWVQVKLYLRILAERDQTDLSNALHITRFGM